MKYQVTEPKYAGKTKRVDHVLAPIHHILGTYLENITRNDTVEQTRRFAGKAKWSNLQNAVISGMLKRAGVSVAFREWVSPTQFLAVDCDMVPVEAVWRNEVDKTGSYAKRHPELVTSAGEDPHRFETPLVELFLKTTNGAVRGLDGTMIPVNLSVNVQDPLILTPGEPVLLLGHPKEKGSPEIGRIESMPLFEDDTLAFMQENVLRAAEVIRAIFDRINWVVPDGKVEYGRARDTDEYVLADVFDLDSFRLYDSMKRYRCKQAFRNDIRNILLPLIAANYGAVAWYLSELEAGRTAHDIEIYLEEWEANAWMNGILPAEDAGPPEDLLTEAL